MITYIIGAGGDQQEWGKRDGRTLGVVDERIMTYMYDTLTGRTVSLCVRSIISLLPSPLDMDYRVFPLQKQFFEAHMGTYCP